MEVRLKLCHGPFRPGRNLRSTAGPALIKTELKKKPTHFGRDDRKGKSKNARHGRRPLQSPERSLCSLAGLKPGRYSGWRDEPACGRQARRCRRGGEIHPAEIAGWGGGVLCADSARPNPPAVTLQGCHGPSTTRPGARSRFCCKRACAGKSRAASVGMTEKGVLFFCAYPALTCFVALRVRPRRGIRGANGAHRMTRGWPQKSRAQPPVKVVAPSLN